MFCLTARQYEEPQVRAERTPLYQKVPFPASNFPTAWCLICNARVRDEIRLGPGGRAATATHVSTICTQSYRPLIISAKLAPPASPFPAVRIWVVVVVVVVMRFGHRP